MFGIRSYSSDLGYLLKQHNPQEGIIPPPGQRRLNRLNSLVVAGKTFFYFLWNKEKGKVFPRTSSRRNYDPGRMKGSSVIPRNTGPYSRGGVEDLGPAKIREEHRAGDKG